jgi:hypothetical protein
MFDIHVTADAVLLGSLTVYERLSVLHKLDEGSFNTSNKLSSSIDSEDTVNVLSAASFRPVTAGGINMAPMKPRDIMRPIEFETAF